MNLSPHFTLDEFCASDTASRLGINNSLPIELLGTAKTTAAMMESIRSYLTRIAGKDIPIYISSGYRCPALNAAIGSKGADHPKALAVDWRAPDYGPPYAICKAVVPVMAELGIGQIIYEHTWVHCSTKAPNKLINRIITLAGNGYVTGIVA